ncbi:MAG: hypothetical protein AB1806_00385 [Acidobacteriota bacterium]
MARKLTNFWIDADLAAGLHDVKNREGIPVGEQIRRAVRAWLIEKRVIKAERKRAGTRRRS